MISKIHHYILIIDLFVGKMPNTTLTCSSVGARWFSLFQTTLCGLITAIIILAVVHAAGQMPIVLCTMRLSPLNCRCASRTDGGLPNKETLLET